MQNFIIHGFENLVWLLVWGVVFLCVILFASLKKSRSNFIDEDLLLQVYGKNSYWYYIYWILTSIITFLFFIILAWPYSNNEIEKIKKNGIDIEIVFDLSYSMVAQDLLPNRLEAAKSVFRDFVSWIQNDRVWLILFAGKAFQSIPLSYDYDFLNQFIAKIDIETIDWKNSNLQGTAIWDALVLANDVLSKGETQREKIVILITDGAANRWVDANIVLKLLSENDIKVYAIWVWKDEETFINVMLAPWFNRQVAVAGVDEGILKNISRLTGWKYYRADNTESLKEILKTISYLEKTEIEMEIILFHSSKRWVFLYLLILSFTALGYIVFFKRIQI
jgi:Ca-activated chloride channel family protein